MTWLLRTKVVDALACPIHDNVDDVVADVTLNAKGLPVIGILPALTISVIWNIGAITAGAVKKNVNVEPSSAVASVTNPPPDGPYVGTSKSVINPVVAPAPSRTFTVHDIISAMRINDVSSDVWPMHDKIDETVGIPALVQTYRAKNMIQKFWIPYETKN